MGTAADRRPKNFHEKAHFLLKLKVINIKAAVCRFILVNKKLNEISETR